MSWTIRLKRLRKGRRPDVPALLALDRALISGATRWRAERDDLCAKGGVVLRAVELQTGETSMLAVSPPSRGPEQTAAQRAHGEPRAALNRNGGEPHVAVAARYLHCEVERIDPRGVDNVVRVAVLGSQAKCEASLVPLPGYAMRWTPWFGPRMAAVKVEPASSSSVSYI